MIYREFRLFLLNILFRFPPTRAWAEKRLPQHTRGYRQYWNSPASKRYRESMYQRQKDMDANPTFEEMRHVLGAYAPKTVLNVGCGYGRELIALSPFFNIEGCDIAPDLLAKVPSEIPTFMFDIVEDTTSRKWDVLFCRAVMMYFPDRTTLEKAMRHMEAMANTKVVVWEWPHVCARMQDTYPSNKFAYLPIAYRQDE